MGISRIARLNGLECLLFGCDGGGDIGFSIIDTRGLKGLVGLLDEFGGGGDNGISTIGDGVRRGEGIKSD